MKNPFIYRSVVLRKDFFNREQIIKTILNEAIVGTSQGDVWITGERKVGKTSLIKYIHQNYQELIPEFVDIYEINKTMKPIFAFANVQYCRTETEFYNELWQSVNNELDVKYHIPDEPEINFINAVKDALDTNFYIVFLIDEFDAFLETMAIESPTNVRSFINKLNSFLNSFTGYSHKVFSCVFTSNQEIQDLDNKYNLQLTGSGLDIKNYELEWFSKNQIIQLTKKYLQESTFIFSEKEIDILYKYTDGYPYFSQRILYLMFEYKNKNQVKEIDELVIRKFAQEEYEQTIRFWLGQNMNRRTYEKLNNLLKNVGKGIFKAALIVLEAYSKSKF